MLFTFCPRSPGCGYVAAVVDALLRIGELSRRTGVSADVIRAWERRYDLLEPQRTDGGFRLYSTDDLSRLRLMQHYLAKGLPAAQAAGLVHRVRTAAMNSNPGIPPGDVRRALRVLRESLECFDDAPADRMLERLLGVFAPGAVLRDVVLVYLRELGGRWACGEATIAQEHFASSFLEGWMLSMAHGWSRSGRSRAVLACVPGERHTLGLIAFGLSLRDLGWKVTYIGPDTPVHAVDQAAGAVAADAVVVSCALPGTFAAAADDLRELSARHSLAIGGAAVARNRSPWLAARALPSDPVIAAQTLAEQEPAAAAADERLDRPARMHASARTT
jgi:MerR family transcriptional regulator, light-induced transcriptional regulator